MNTGSPQHYFHFLIGYLLPLVDHLSKWPLDSFKVLDCGPLMTRHLEESLGKLGFNYSVVERTRISYPYFLQPSWLSTSTVIKTINEMKELFTEFTCSSISGCKSSSLLILDRSPVHPFYQSQQADIKGYGKGRRSIKNIQELHSKLTYDESTFNLYDSGAHSLGCQINVFSKAQVIIGIRGSEFANAIWCEADTNVLMVDPAPPAREIEKVFQVKKLNFVRLKVSSSTPELNIEEIQRLINKFSVKNNGKIV
jgi:hypothetical protein